MSQSTRSRPLARHAEHRSPGVVAQLMKLLGIALSVLLVSGLGVAGFVVVGLGSQLQAGAVELEGQGDLPPDISAYEGGFDIFLAGIDVCEEKYAHLFGDRCSDPDEEGTLNDVNLLVHVSAAPRRVTVMSLPRDMMVPIPSCTDETGYVNESMYKQALNTAWGYGGLNCVVKTVAELTGENIEFAAAITFGGVIEITNAIGGVEVCVASPIVDSETDLNLSAGTHTIEGLEALKFLRTRYGVGDGSDLGRIGNQQQYMSSLVRKLMSGETLGNIPMMLKLADTAIKNITPSTTLADPSRMVQIALAMKDVPLRDFVFIQYPTLDDPDNPGVKVVPDYEAAAVLWDAVRANKTLNVTHEANENDGAAPVTPSPAPDAGDETAEPAPTAEPTPGSTPPGDVVDLPSNIRGNNAETATCSNGRIND